MPTDNAPAEATSSSSSAAGSVAIGILASRLVGLLRERVLAYYFGVGAHADVWTVASRAPNLLQNLLGEGIISASFIPIYSRLLEDGRPEAAGRFAGAIFGLLTVVVGGVVLLGVVFAKPLATVLAAGFLSDPPVEGAAVDRFALLVTTLRILFPMTGLLVLSAWALGVLNSHRRFFVPYIAPVLWNVAIIAGLVAGAYLVTGSPWTPTNLSSDALTRLLIAASVGAVAGGALQLGVQLPFVGSHLRGFRLSLSTRVEGVREALSAFGPVIAGRGVAQFSSYLDTFLATFLAVGALSALRYAQLFYLLPISLFGMSVAASELPELSRLTGDQVKGFLERLRRSLRQIAFLTVPTIVGYLAFGVLLVWVLLRTGQLQSGSTWLDMPTLAGYSLGILATTFSRLLQNAFYAIGDTKTPARYAVVRVTASTAVALPMMLLLDRVALSDVVTVSMPAETLFLGALGLSLGATVGAWLEFGLLVRALRPLLPDFSIPWRPIGLMGGLALGAVCPAGALWWTVPHWPAWGLAPLVGGAFAATYLAAAAALGLPDIKPWLDRLRR